MASQTATTITREAPEIEALRIGLMKDAQTLAGTPVSLPAYQTAGITQLQQDAINRAMASYDPTADLQAARDYLGATVGQDPAAVQAAMDPYIDTVVKGAQQDIADQAQMQQQQLAANALSSGAFGGSRAGVAQGVLASEAAKQAGNLGAQLRSQGYSDAMQRLGMASQGIAGLGQMQQALEQQGIGFGFDVGAREQAIEQAQLDALRQSQLQQSFEPYQRLGFMSDIYAGAPSTQMTFTQGTAPASPSPMQQLFGYGIAGLSAAGGAKQLGLF